jgi:hypothetical protein
MSTANLAQQQAIEDQLLRESEEAGRKRIEDELERQREEDIEARRMIALHTELERISHAMEQEKKDREDIIPATATILANYPQNPSSNAASLRERRGKNPLKVNTNIRRLY